MSSRHLPLPNPLTPALQVLRRRAHAWALGSQQGACRNALVANTALLSLRREREDVETWFERYGTPVVDDVQRAARVQG